MQPILYFAFLLLTGVLAGFLAFYAWRQRLVPGVRPYAALSLCEFLLVLAEILSMLSPTTTQALFWFQARYTAIAFITVFWLLFALAYSGWHNLISKRLLAGLFIIPAITQVLLWSNNWFRLWAKHDVGFHQSGPFWLADMSARIPGPGFLTHSFYSLTLLLAGIALLLVTAWRLRRQFWGQALWLTGAGLIAFVFAVNSIFNLMPQAEFNLFTPGLGLSILLVALAVFRFQFLTRAPTAESDPKIQALAAQTQRSLVVILLIFIVMTAGLATLGYLSYQNYESQFRAQVENQLTSIAELKVNGLVAWRKERLGDAKILHQNPAFSVLAQRYLDNPADAPAQTELQGWLDKYRSYGQYDRLILLDAAGVERMSSPVTPEPATAYLINEVTAILRAGQVTFVDFHRDTAGPIHLSLAVPIYGQPDNRPLGVLVLYIDPNVYLYPYLQQWPAPSASAETLLVRREGTDVLFLNELKFNADAALSLRFPLTNTNLSAARAVLGQEGIVEGLDYRNEPVIAAVRAVPNSPWFLVARMDTTEVYAPLRERLWQTAAFFGALLAATGALLLLVWRQQRLRYYRGQAVAAEALRLNQQRLSLALEAAHAGTWEWDLKTNENFWSEELWAVYGLELHSCQPSYEAWLQTIHPDDRTLAAQVVQEAANQEVELNAEWRVLDPDGVERWLMSRGRPMRNAQGKVTRYMGIVLDITERKQAETQILAVQAELQRLLDEANQSRQALLSVVEDQKQTEVLLRESETRYRMLFENAQVGIYRTTPAGRILTANPALVQMLGFSSFEELVARNLEQEGYAPDYPRNRFKEQLERENEVKGMDSVWVKHDGSTIFVRENARVIREANGTVLYYEGTVEDITQRKQAEEALATERALLRTIIDTLPVLIYTKDIACRKTLANHVDLEYMGASSEAEVLGKTDFDFYPPDTAAQFYTHDQAVIQTGQPLLDYEHNIVKTDGQQRWLFTSKVPLRDSAGQIIGLVGVGQDITERKQAEEKIRATLAEKEVLLREVHHRVKNNLQAIIALAEMRLDQVGDAPARLWLKEFQEQARTMSLVYEQLYQADNLAQVDMLPYLQNLAFNAFAAFGEGQGIDLRLEVESISLDVSTAMPCGLIVNELLTNALKHAFPSSFTKPKCVTVGLKAEDGRYVLWISDNGVGLPPGQGEQQAKSLGLRLVDLWATHQLGGRLEVDNRAGVTFKITLNKPDKS